MIKQILKPINYHIRYKKYKGNFLCVQIRDSRDFEPLWKYGYEPSTLAGLFKEVYGDQMDLFKASRLLKSVKPKP